MGQQQVLLIILVAIIVGIATIVAINIFGTSMENNNRDAVQEDMLRAASAAQGVWHQIEALGGAGRDFENNLTRDQLMDKLHFTGVKDPDNPTVLNENAEYTLSDVTDSGFTITADPAAWPFDIVLTINRESDTGNWVYEIITE